MSDEPEPERKIPEDWIDEQTLIAGFVKWAHANAIRLDVYSYKEIEEFIMRYLKAAG